MHGLFVLQCPSLALVNHLKPFVSEWVWSQVNEVFLGNVSELSIELFILAVHKDSLHYIVAVVNSNKHSQNVLFAYFLSIQLNNWLLGFVESLLNHVWWELLHGELLEMGYEVLSEFFTVLWFPIFQCHLEGIVSIGILAKSHSVLVDLVNHFVLNTVNVKLLNHSLDYW